MPQPFTPPEPLSALIFDCDGTLVDTIPLHCKALNNALQDYDAEVDEDWYTARAGLTQPDLLKEVEKEKGLQLDLDAMAEAIGTYYRSNLETLKEKTAVVDVARRYHGKLPMAVASNGHRDLIEATLKVTGLETLFSIVISADDVKQGKPAPDLYLEACKRLNVPPEECYVFEDSNEGIEAARKAGIRVCDIRKDLDGKPSQPELEGQVSAG